MSKSLLHSPAVLDRPPAFVRWMAYPRAFFAAALATDIAYWQTATMQWANFAAWLLTAGLVTGGLVVVAFVFGILSRSGRAAAPAWPAMVGNLLALGLEFVNIFVHSRDAYTSVVPTGLTLSVLAVIILLVASWLERPFTRRSIVEASR